MKSIKLLIISSLICALFPAVSFAEESDADAKAAIEAVAKNPKVIQYRKAEAAMAEKDFKKASEILIPLAAEDYKSADDVTVRTVLGAKTILGAMYFKGEGVERDINKGLGMIMEAAGQGFEQAKGLAAALNKELATLGDEKAMYNVGYMCLKGWGGEQDPNMCIQWLEKAAENGHTKSAKILSQIYTDGKYGIAPNKEKATQYSGLAK